MNDPYYSIDRTYQNDPEMSIDSWIPDYELHDQIVVTAPAQPGLADLPRATILDLLLERAATVAELATAVARLKSTVAHHVNVLVEAGMLRVVRTRRARRRRALLRTHGARVLLGVVNRPGEDSTTVHANALSVAAAESVPAHEADDPRSILRHARIPAQSAAEFWERVVARATSSPSCHAPATPHGFGAGLYPTDYPTLPDPNEYPGDGSAERSQ